ncbi:YybH family protein [Mycobacterium sp. C31M]
MSRSDIDEILTIERTLLTATSIEEALHHYEPDVVRYTFVPPHQMVGHDAVAAYFDAMFTANRSDSKAEFVTDPVVVLEGNMAVAFCMEQYRWTEADGMPYECVFRVTDCFHKVDGKWKIYHAHISCPINYETGLIQKTLVE